MQTTIRLLVIFLLAWQIHAITAFGAQPAALADDVIHPHERLQVLEIAPDHLTIQLDYGALEWKAGNDSLPYIAGMFYITESGEPRLPASVHIFQAPPGTASVNIISQDYTIHNCGRIPAKLDDCMTVSDSPVYQHDSFFPGKTAEIAPIGSFRGRKLMRLLVLPLHYNPVKNEVKYHRSLKLRINFTVDQNLVQPSQPLSGSAERVLKALLSEMPQTASYPSTAQNISGGSTGVYAQTQSVSSSPSGIKIGVSEEGLHRVTYEALSDSGIDVRIFGDPRNLALTCLGQNIPIYVYGEGDGSFDPGDYFDFWGVPNRQTYQAEHPEMYTDPWSDVNIYWLSWGGAPGAHMIEETVEIVTLADTLYYHPYSYNYTIHEEADNNYNRLTQVPRDSIVDHWYYDSGIDGFESKNYYVYIPYPQSTSVEYAQMKVAMMGLTYPVTSYPLNQTTGRHHVWMTFNGYTTPSMQAGMQVNGEWPWVGQNLWMVETAGSQGIPNNILHHGNNTLTILCPGDTPSGSNDTVLLNWFELTYLRQYYADNGWIRFTRPDDGPTECLYDFEIKNFANPDILFYKLGSSRLVEYEMELDNQSNTYTLHFQDMLFGDEEYVALTADNIKTPDFYIFDTPSNLKSAANQAGYIIITSEEFLDNQALSELRSRRASQGAVIVDVSDIFDEFNYGIQNPESVREFLKYAYYNWMEPQPFQVIIVGDGSWDQKNRFGNGGNLVPSYYMQTEGYGSAASDVWFTIFDGDDYVPEMTIGRIPARTETELEAYLAKIFEYETSPEPGEWHNRYLFIAGNAQGFGSSFSDLSEECIKLLPPVFFPERLESVEDLTSPFNGSTPELQEFFRSGVSMVNYNGHGAGQIWADNALFTLADVANMNNQGFYPFIANFTCFICSYDDIKPRTTLGEEFIFAPNEGAIGVYGSTGTGWFEEGHALQKAMVGLLQSNERLTQGDLVWLSKVMYLAVKGQFSAYFDFNANAHATLYTMALLGDPGLEIKTPLYRNEIQMNPIISRGDTIILESQAPFPSGYAVGRIFNKDQEPIFRQNLVWQTQPALFTNNNVSISIDTTMVGFPHRGTFRVSYWNPQNSEDGHLFADFYTIEDFMITTVFDSAKIVPDTVTTADSIYFYTKIVDGQGIVWAKAVYYIEDPSTQPYLPPDSVDLNRIDTEDIIWRSDTLPPFTELLGYFIRYYFIAEDSLGNIVSSQTPQSPYKTEKIYDHRPDLETYPGIVTFGGEEQLELTAKILGKNDNRVDSALVQFWAGSSKLKYDIIGNVWIYDISDSIPKYATVIPPFKEGEYAVHIVIDPDNLIDDSDTGNNTADLNITVDRVHVSPALGSNFEDEQLNFHFHDYILTVQPGAVSDSTLMAAAIDSNLAAVNQASLGFYDEGTGINIWMTKHPDTLLTADGLIIKRLIASPQPGMVDSSGAIHRWHPVSQAWVKLPASYEPVSSSEYYVVSSTAVLGKFALLSNFDNIGPFAEITIDGQLYSSGGYVPSRPRIAALFQDVGGVNPNSLWAALDDDTLEMENLSTPVILDNSRSVSTTIHQELAHGEHTITFGASDMSGNCSSISIQVEVADGFDFQFIGNYPNPFKNHTYIACNLTDQPDGDLTVKIYTVAGRLVRTLIEPARVNYNEIYWDGKDCDGSVLANGVYFYRVTANKGGKKLEKLKKMAKVR